MSKLLVIIGVTGLQGGSVLRTFQDEPGWRIRGITRNPSKHAHLTGPNIELVAGDLDDPTSLARAFTGATAIFAVTDFWQFLRGNDAETFERAAREGKAPNEIAMAREEQQGRNIVHAAAEVAGLERLVLSTLSDSRAATKGAITWNLHFDGKAHVAEYLRATLPALAQRTSYLHMGFYLTNWQMHPVLAPRRQEDGSVVIPAFARPGGKEVPWVDAARDTGPFVRQLVLVSPPETQMLGTCDEMTIEAYAALWGRLRNVRCEVRHLTREDAEQAGMPDWMALEVSQSGTYASVYGWAGGDASVKRPAELGVDASLLTDVEEFIRRENWDAVV